MSENQLWEQIMHAQNDKGQALLNLIEKFSPLIYKYSGLLGYEDAKNELQYDFISLILGVNIQKFSEFNESAILSYIRKTIYHSYIARSKIHSKEKRCNSISNLCPSDQYKVENLSAETNECDYEQLLIGEIKDVLNAHEFTIIYQHFFLWLSIEEIALQFGTTRQSINQSKKRALKKLRYTIYKE